MTFLEGQAHAQAFGINVTPGHGVCINWHFSFGTTQGVVCNWGPEGPICQFARNVKFWNSETDLAHIRTYQRTNAYLSVVFRVVRVIGIFPRQLKGAAGPNPSLDSDQDGDEPDKELISISASTKVKYSF